MQSTRDASSPFHSFQRQHVSLAIHGKRDTDYPPRLLGSGQLPKIMPTTKPPP